MDVRLILLAVQCIGGGYLPSSVWNDKSFYGLQEWDRWV